MADLKLHMFRHLRSARQWLVRAEESFDKQSNIRGELDLFLAQAELQHARETHSSRQWRYRYPLIRHVASLVIALAIFSFGFGTYWWSMDRNIVVPAQLAAQEITVVPAGKPIGGSAADQVRVEEPRAVTPAAVAANPAPVTFQAVDPPQKLEQGRQAEKQDLVPPSEMQKIIRAAGKTLRGQ